MYDTVQKFLQVNIFMNFMDSIAPVKFYAWKIYTWASCACGQRQTDDDFITCQPSCIRLHVCHYSSVFHSWVLKHVCHFQSVDAKCKAIWTMNSSGRRCTFVSYTAAANTEANYDTVTDTPGCEHVQWRKIAATIYLLRFFCGGSYPMASSISHPVGKEYKILYNTVESFKSKFSNSDQLVYTLGLMCKIIQNIHQQWVLILCNCREHG